jgi:predicted solute-binding protein
MTPLVPIYRKHGESIGQESFLRMPLNRSWRRLTMTPLVFAVLVLLLTGCASNRHLQQQQQHSSDTPFFDTPDVDSLH